MNFVKRVPLITNANVRLPESTTQTFINLMLEIDDPSFKTQYLRSQMMTKFVSSETDPASTRRQRAINKWLATERDNEGTNTRLILLHEEYNILPRVTWCAFREKVCDIVTSIIGEVPPVEALIGSFSGGASTSRRRTESYPASKYTGKADVTQRAIHYFEELSSEIPGWSRWWDDLISLEVVPGNVLFTVPKTTVIDRCACKEPDVNMFLQKGAGRFIRQALRSVGQDLNDQSRNKTLARQGSIDGLSCTMDLSSASDSISRELVFQMLPIHWFTFLDAIRCQVTIIDGEEHVNEMFSSMGNGFTFELESLLFYSVCRAVNFFRGYPGVVSVYGDDIITPVGAYHDTAWVLSVLGFEVNSSKSFYEGKFRESCGGHFYGGHDVTPFFLRAPIVELSDLIHMGNSLRKWADDFGIGILNDDVWPVWSWIKAQIPESLWGGGDLSFKFQLVTPDRPRYRLMPVSKPKMLGDGAYYHWLNATWARETETDAIETSVLRLVGNHCRLRPAVKTAVTDITPLFLEELSNGRLTA